MEEMARCTFHIALLSCRLRIKSYWLWRADSPRVEASSGPNAMRAGRVMSKIV